MPIRGEARIASALGEAPSQSGVYALYENSMLIYIGAAIEGESTIQERLREHKVGNKGPCTKWFTHYRYEITDAQMTRERELLQEYSKRYGRLPRCNKEIP